MAMNWIDQGGFLANPELNKEFQMAAQPLMRFRQFVSVKNAMGKGQGESVNWDKVANVSTYGGNLIETATMHSTPVAITKGTLTISEMGNSIPHTFKMSTLSFIDIMKIIRESLLNDAAKCIDGKIEREFNSALLRYVGTAANGYALTTNGTATATNTSVLNSYHVRKMVNELKKRNVPGWSGKNGELGGDYAAICSIEALESLFGAVESVQQYTESGYKKLLAGEVGRYYGVRFLEDTFATRFTYDADARTATAKSWTQSQSLEAYLFGSPTVMEGVAVREQIRAKEVTDYGRSLGLAWYFLGGWKIFWDTAADTRIIKWDSAA